MLNHQSYNIPIDWLELYLLLSKGLKWIVKDFADWLIYKFFGLSIEFSTTSPRSIRCFFYTWAVACIYIVQIFKLSCSLFTCHIIIQYPEVIVKLYRLANKKVPLWQDVYSYFLTYKWSLLYKMTSQVTIKLKDQLMCKFNRSGLIDIQQNQAFE